MENRWAWGVDVKRWLTALIIGPPLVWVIYKGSEFQFFLILLFTISISLYEFYNMVFKGENQMIKWAALTIGSLPAIATYHDGLRPVLGTLVFCIVGLFVLFLFTNKPDISLLNGLGKGVLGVVYISLLGSHLLLIRGLPLGREWVVLVLATVFCGDTGAYYTGRTLGRHKLWPAVSPGKTVEGCIGGLLASILGGLTIRSLMIANLPLSDAIIFASVMGIVGQVGDLCESVVKRASQVKDSGKLLPGHGGMLDRIDGLLFAAPLAYYYITTLCGMD